MTDIKVKQLRMEMEIINQDKDSALYNGAIADYNIATNRFNDFITYRNNQFKPAKPDSEIKNMFTKIEQNVTSAKTKLAEVNRSKAALALDTGDIEYALDKLSTHVKEQLAFFKNYQSTAKNK